MKITFLGTGTSQGIPLIGCTCKVCTSADPKDKRLRSSVMIESKSNCIVIDTGPDFRQQMLREKVKKLDAVIFTHEHKDHIAGLDEVRAFNFINGIVMPVYATERVQVALKREFAYIFSGEDYPGIPKIDMKAIHDDVFVIGDLKIQPINVLHYKLPVKAFRIGNFTYITDANFISEEEKQKIKGSEVVVINALRRNEHISHFTFNEAIDLANELKAKKTYFTHISHQLGLHSEVSLELPEHIELGYDGLQIEVS
ncbi:MAG TPA: MBL fold metallo-hydrolase [Bacteroidia bacterium]|jgi:phosphoribosyl 1,2-cyclic phosphate phosphodiesterase|nr:MBL fold metallo-hydrolase [Bacteroidia bacterium]